MYKEYCEECEKFTRHFTTEIIKKGNVYIRHTCEECGTKTDIKK